MNDIDNKLDIDITYLLSTEGYYIILDRYETKIDRGRNNNCPTSVPAILATTTKTKCLLKKDSDTDPSITLSLNA